MQVTTRQLCVALLLCIITAFLGTAVPAAKAQTSSASYKVKWHIVSASLYLNKKETKKLAVGSGLGASAAVLLPPPFDAVVGVGAATLAAYAANADIDGKCVAVKLRAYGLPGTLLQLFSYGAKDQYGRYCR